MNEGGVNIDQIIRTLLTQNNTSGGHQGLWNSGILRKFVAEYGILAIFWRNDGILPDADFLENDKRNTEFS